MMKKDKHIANEEPTPTLVRLEWLDILLVTFAFFSVLNVIIALIVGRVDTFRLIPAWLILMAICLTQRQLENHKLLTIILGTAICYGTQTLMHLTHASAAELRSQELAISVALVYVPLFSFFVVLCSAKVDNLQSQRDQLHTKLVRLRTDANDLVNKLHKIRSRDSNEQEDTGDETLIEKRHVFDLYGMAFRGVMDIRYRRDVAHLLRKVLSGPLAIEQGVVYEAPDERGGEFKYRVSWGVPKNDAVENKAASYRSSELVKHVVIHRRPLFMDELTRSPTLHEAFDSFRTELFPLECLLPVLHQERVLYVIVVGRQQANAPIRFSAQLVEPILSTAGQAIGKLMSRDARPSFSTFNPEG